MLDLIADARIGVEDIGWGHMVNHRFDLILGKQGLAMGHAPAVERDAADEITGTLADSGVISVLSSLLSTRTTMEATP